MHIKSLAITRRPIWFDVLDESLEKFEFSARARFWPTGTSGAALFLFVFPEPIDKESLSHHRITQSDIGNYVYLDVDTETGCLRQTISIPHGKVKRIGIRTWNSETPVLLEDISIALHGGILESEHTFERKYITKELDKQFANISRNADALALNLLSSTDACSSKCHAICQHWYKTMDDVQRRHPQDDAGRTNCYLKTVTELEVPITVFHAQPAMLRIPKDISNYLDKIGDKSRNMIRKAQRLGYIYKKVDPDQYLDDVLAIRTSDPLRQGKPIPQYFKERPERILAEAFQANCQFHGEDFYGVFKDDQLIAYTTIFFYGQLGQVNHILGHKEHLKNGVMNLLTYEMVHNIIQHKPWVRAINYLYPDVARSDSGTGMFKKSIGFYPETVVVTQSNHDLTEHFTSVSTEDEDVIDAPTPVKKSIKAGTTKLIKESEDGEQLIFPVKMENQVNAFDFAIHKLSELTPQLKTTTYQFSTDTIKESDFHPGTTHAVVIKGMTFNGYQHFLSTGLKSFRESIPKNSFLIFDFMRTPDLAHVRETEGLSQFLPQAFQSRSRKINEDLIGYLSKRFKSTDLSVDNVRSGFKGSDYIVKGMVDYEHVRAHMNFDSILILKKIR